MVLNYKSDKKEIKKGLYIVATPIGNLGDITYRAVDILSKSDFILCEDTRVSKNLFDSYGIKSKLISNHKFNEKRNLSKVIQLLKSGSIISLVSDAGTPAVSDPGSILVKECIKNDIDVMPIPGPSAVSAAISVSGFSDKFYSYGFLPEKISNLEKELDILSKFNFSIVFFISPKKINKSIEPLKKYFSGRKILIAKEITKIHETFIREDVDNLKLFKNSLKGELTIVISENNIKNKNFDEKKIVNKIKKYLKKYSLKDTVNLILESEKINKKKIYDLCLKVKNGKNF